MVSVRRSLAWMAAAQGSLFVLQFVVSILVARVLSPYEMGIFAVALSIVGVLSIFRSFGLGAYVIRAKELPAPLRATVFTINALLSLVVASAIAGFSVLGGAVLEEPGVRHLLLFMAILPLIGIFDFLPAAGIERRGDFRTVAIVNILRYSTANISTLAMAYAGFSYMSLGYGQLISAIVALVMNNILGRQWITLRLGLQQWREVTRFGTQMLTLSAISGLQGRLADLLLARFLGLAALGVFSRATSLTGVLWDNLHIVVLRVLFVDFAEQRRQGRSLRHSYLRLTRMLTGFLWPAFIGMAVLSGPIVIQLLGDPWAEAILPLSILAVSAALFVLIMVSHDVFVICNQTGLRTRLELIRAPVSLALFAMGCWISLPAAAAMKVVEAIIMVLMYRPHLERMTDTRWADYLPIYGQSALLTTAAVLPAAAVMTAHGWSAHIPFPLVLAGVGTGIMAWCVVLWATQHPLFDEMRRFVSQLRSARAAPSAPPAR